MINNSESWFIERFGKLPTDTQYIKLLELIIGQDGIHIDQWYPNKFSIVCKDYPHIEYAEDGEPLYDDISVGGVGLRQTILNLIKAINEDYYDTDLGIEDDIVRIMEDNNDRN